MNESNDKQHSESRRKFVKVAVTTAYVAPLVASMPAKACFTHTGSVDNGVCDGEVMNPYQDPNPT